MPQKKAAYKALRQDAKKYARNRNLLKKIKDIRKKADKFLAEKKIDEVKSLYQTLQKSVDKASKSGGFMKPNTAARYKSQLRKKIKAALKK